jgi:hypothetical protein
MSCVLHLYSNDLGLFYNLLQHTVIVVSGENARQKFFTTKGLDLTEGFKILSGAVSIIFDHLLIFTDVGLRYL